MAEHPVVVEVGQRRAFAAAIEWPGWCRSGRDEQAALEQLSAAAERYGTVAQETGVTFSFRSCPTTTSESMHRLATAATEFKPIPTWSDRQRCCTVNRDSDPTRPRHPARFPIELPNFFINLMTRPDDLVIDPFAGTCTTAVTAETLGRRWLVNELEQAYAQVLLQRLEAGR
jgi:hypothetical protein